MNPMLDFSPGNQPLSPPPVGVVPERPPGSSGDLHEMDSTTIEHQITTDTDSVVSRTSDSLMKWWG